MFPIGPIFPIGPMFPIGPISPFCPFCPFCPIPPGSPLLPWSPSVPLFPWGPVGPCEPRSPVLFNITLTEVLLPKVTNVPPWLVTDITYHWFPVWISISVIAKSENIVELPLFEILIHPLSSDRLESIFDSIVDKSLLLPSVLLK